MKSFTFLKDLGMVVLRIGFAFGWAFPVEAVGNPTLEMLPGARAMGLGGVILTSDCGADAIGDSPSALFSRHRLEGTVGIRLVDGNPYNLVNFAMAWEPVGGIAIGLHLSSLGVPDLRKSDEFGAMGESQTLSQTTASAAFAGRLLFTHGFALQAGTAVHLALSSDPSFMRAQPVLVDFGLTGTLFGQTRVTAAWIGAPMDVTAFAASPLDLRFGVVQRLEAPNFLASAFEFSAKFLTAELSPIASIEASILDRLLTLRGAVLYLGDSQRFAFTTGAGLGLQISKKGGLHLDLDYGLRVQDGDLTHVLGARAGVSY